MSDCVFCGIVARTQPAQELYRDDATVAFMDINPATTGHLLVIPNIHVRDLWEATAEQHAAIGRTVHRMATAVRDALHPDGLNLLQSNGAVAFQSVFHLHTHVVPRWHTDGIRLPWVPSPGEPSVIAETADALRDALG